MLTSILGLGGGGTRVAREFRRWMQLTTGENVIERLPEDPEHDGWLYIDKPPVANQTKGEGVYFENALGFAILDAFAGDLAGYATGEGFPDWTVYQVAQQQGFGGDYLRARQVIEHSQQEMVQSQGPAFQRLQADEDEPILDWMHDKLRLGVSHVVIPCLSMVGGTGRGTFEFLREYWPWVFPDNPTTLVAAVVPPLSEFQNPAYAREALSYAKVLKKMLRADPSMSVFLTSYDLAQAAFSAAGDPEKMEHMREWRNLLQEGLQRRDSNVVISALGELSMVDSSDSEGQMPVDSGILIALLPLISSCVGPMASDEFIISDVPGTLDPADLRRYFGGQFVVPCYTEIHDPLEEISAMTSRQMGYYRSLGVQNPNVLTYMTDLALNVGSMLPLPVESQSLKKIASSVVAIVWSRDPLVQGYSNGIAQYLRSVHGVDPVVLFIDENDPIKRYLDGGHMAEGFAVADGEDAEPPVEVSDGESKTGRKEATVRIWLYVVLKNEKPLLDFAKLAGSTGN